MAITVPKDGDTISATTFGAPVANAVNQLQTDNARIGGTWRRVAAQSIPNSTLTGISWDTEDIDTNAFAVPPFTFVRIPTGLAGIYLVNAVAYVGTESGALELDVNSNAKPPSARANPHNAWCSVSYMGYMNVNEYVQVNIWQNSGAAINSSNAQLSLYRLSP